tara:strand:- start:318 stop:2012 length:1695 start_codon:yes stop_codon:yes gene_type:complete
MAFTGKNIVPIVDGGAGLGSITKGWGGAFITNVTASSATQGGKLVLAANDGAVMASGHRLGVIEFKGAEDTASTLTIGARIEALCDATWSDEENGASLKMYTTDANASESLVLTLDSDKLATFAGQIKNERIHHITNTTTSSATEGGMLNLISDDGAALGDDHRLGRLAFQAAEDGAGTIVQGASIEAYADAGWGPNENGTRLEFYTKDADSVKELSLTLDSDLLATFTGAVTVTGALTGTLATASQPNVTTLAGLRAIGTADTPIVVTSDTITFTSASADDPTITIKNTSSGTDDMAMLNFVKDRGTAPAIGDNLAEIRFFGEDSGQNEQEYGRIFCETDVVTHGQESGKLSLGVANHDGGNGYGLILTGGSEDNEIDVTVGLGANSVVTVPGGLSLGTDLPTNQQKHLAYFTFKGYGSSDGTNYDIGEQMSDNQAPFQHDTSSGSDGLTAQTVQTSIRTTGHIMPYSGVIKKWVGWSTSAGSGTVDVGLFKITPTASDASDLTPVLLHNIQYTASGQDEMLAISENSFSVAFSAGDKIISAVKGGTSAKAWFLDSTLEVEWS